MSGRRAKKKANRPTVNKFEKKAAPPDAEAPSKKVPGFAADSAKSADQMFTWTAREIDHRVGDSPDCDWSWDLPSDQAVSLIQFLDEASKKTWGELEAEETGGRRRRKKHHSQSIDTVVKHAQKRLETTNMISEGEEELFRFRLSGTQRLWGFRSGSLFRMIWWDPEHRVYPTEKD